MGAYFMGEAVGRKGGAAHEISHAGVELPLLGRFAQEILRQIDPARLE